MYATEQLMCFNMIEVLSFQFSHSVVSNSLQPMNCSTAGFPVHHQLLEFAQDGLMSIDWVLILFNFYKLKSLSLASGNHIRCSSTRENIQVVWLIGALEIVCFIWFTQTPKSEISEQKIGFYDCEPQS